MADQHEWTLENAVACAVRQLKQDLPAILTERLTYDLARPAGKQLFAGQLPVPSYIGGDPMDDLASDRITPSVFVQCQTSSFSRADASSIMHSSSVFLINTLITESDAGAADGQVFEAVLTAYAEAIMYVLCTRFVDRSVGFGCDAGVLNCTPQSLSTSPMVRNSDASVWMRANELQVSVLHRWFSRWDVSP